MNRALREILDDFFIFNKDLSLDHLDNSYPPHNIFLEDNKLYFEIACAGFKPDELTIETEKGNIIKVIGKKKDKTDEDKRQYVKRKLAFRDFELKYVIGQQFDLETIKAKYDDGLLIIEICEKEQYQNKKIPIEY